MHSVCHVVCCLDVCIIFFLFSCDIRYKNKLCLSDQSKCVFLSVCPSSCLSVCLFTHLSPSFQQRWCETCRLPPQPFEVELEASPRPMAPPTPPPPLSLPLPLLDAATRQPVALALATAMALRSRPLALCLTGQVR